MYTIPGHFHTQIVPTPTMVDIEYVCNHIPFCFIKHHIDSHRVDIGTQRIDAPKRWRGFALVVVTIVLVSSLRSRRVLDAELHFAGNLGAEDNIIEQDMHAMLTVRKTNMANHKGIDWILTDNHAESVCLSLDSRSFQRDQKYNQSVKQHHETGVKWVADYNRQLDENVQCQNK